MKNLILIGSLLLLSWNGFAHNPLTAKVELNTRVVDMPMLHIYLSQTGLHQALVKYYDTTNFNAISRNEYKKLAVQYLKDHIQLVADDTPLAIGEGGIKLGSHQTDLRFLIKNFPQKVQQLQTTIDIGKENGNHHTVFWWLKKDASSKVVLSQQNNFQSTISADQFMASEQVSSSSITLIYLLAFGLIAIFIGIVFPYKQEPTTSAFV